MKQMRPNGPDPLGGACDRVQGFLVLELIPVCPSPHTVGTPVSVQLSSHLVTGLRKGSDKHHNRKCPEEAGVWAESPGLTKGGGVSFLHLVEAVLPKQLRCLPGQAASTNFYAKSYEISVLTAIL